MPVETKVACFHCGEACEAEPIIFDEREFCCHGCKAVYELISNSQLADYYAGDDLKTSKISDHKTLEKKFAYLNTPEIKEGLVRFQDESRTIVKFHLPGIHCSSCIYLLEHLPKLDDRILKGEVNFIKKDITITFAPQITIYEVAVRLASLGYPPSISLDSQSDKQKPKQTGLGLKIAVAGFCFGNSMLISLPEYLDAGFEIEHAFKSLFGWINIALSLPVVFYAAQDYFKSAITGIKLRYLNIDVPIALGIATLFLRSLYEILWSAGPGYVDSLNGLLFFLLLGKWYQAKSYEALSFEHDYKSYFPISVIKLVDGIEKHVLLKDLKVGDEVIIHNQELVPADAILTGGKGRIDYSFVTGESEVVPRNAGEKVFAGGRQVGGQVTLLLQKEVNNSELTQMWNDDGLDRAKGHKALIDHVSRYFTVVIIVLALGTWAYWFVVDPGKMWDAVASVLIVACPCALALALPFALGHGMRILGRNGIYLKNAEVLERLASIKNIVFDKTGTLTKNDPTSISFVGEPLTPHQSSLVKSVCSNSAHPLSKLVAASFGDEVPKLPIEEFHEEVGSGITAEIADHTVLIGSGKWVGVSEDPAMHESRVYIKVDRGLSGYFRVRAQYRPGIFESLRELREGYRLHLLSGDNATEKRNLEPYLHELRFDQRPKQKLQYLQTLGAPSLMIGDGLNDAGALKAATVGIAVSEDIHQFSPGCDAIMEAQKISRIGNVLKFSRMVRAVVIAAFVISFLYNIVGLSFAISGNLKPVISAILMPISSVTVVGFIVLGINVLSRGRS